MRPRADSPAGILDLVPATRGRLPPRRRFVVLFRDGVAEIPPRRLNGFVEQAAAGGPQAAAAVARGRFLPAEEISDAGLSRRSLWFALADGTRVSYRMGPLPRSLRAMLTFACAELVRRPVPEADPPLTEALQLGTRAAFWSTALAGKRPEELRAAERFYDGLRFGGLGTSEAAEVAAETLVEDQARLGLPSRRTRLLVGVVPVVSILLLVVVIGVRVWQERAGRGPVGPKPQLVDAAVVTVQPLTEPGVYLVPFQGFPGTETARLRAELASRYRVPVHVADPLPLPRYAWNGDRHQLDAWRLVHDELGRLRPQGVRAVVIGLFAPDIFASYDASARFHFTIMSRRVWGAVGTARLGSTGSGDWRARLLKLTLRVAGFESGFHEGSADSAVRPTITSVRDIDSMQAAYCPGSPAAERSIRPGIDASFSCGSSS